MPGSSVLFCPLLSSSSVSRSLLKFMSIESVRLSNRLIICHALLLLPLIFSRIRVFSNESALHIRWAKVSGLSLITCVTLGGKAPHHPELRLLACKMEVNTVTLE